MEPLRIPSYPGGMARVQGIDPAAATDRMAQVFQKQKKTWGVVLDPYLVYARRPSIFLAVRGMWDAFKESGLIDPALATLINRRVASINGCPF